MKDSNGVSGRGRKTCPFYEQVDRILGTRAASCPPVVLESGGGEVSINVASEDDGMLLFLYDKYDYVSLH